MKKILLLILLCLITVKSFSQVTTTDSETQLQTLVGGRYTFKQTVAFKDTSQNDTDHLYTYSMLKGTTVIIHSVSDDGNYIFFRRDPEITFDIYALKKNDFFFYTQQKFQRFKGAEVGVYTIPFKLRGFGSDDFDFETNLSLLANIVFGFGTQTNQVSWFDASVGIGLSSIALSSKNSNVTENRTASALTLSIGGVVKPTSRANIGLFLGGDFLGRNDNNVDWKYDKNLWVGIGVNISFNKVETNKPSDRTTTSEIKELINANENFVKIITGKANKNKQNAYAKAEENKRKAYTNAESLSVDEKTDIQNSANAAYAKAIKEADEVYDADKAKTDAEILEVKHEIEILKAEKKKRIW